MPTPTSPASAWITRFVPQLASGSAVLDLACGGGRHTRLLLDRGHHVTAVDRNLDTLADLAGHDRLELLATDLEDGSAFPLSGRTFGGVVVSCYLHRPILADLVAAVAPGGLLLYETFSREQAGFGRPMNPDFLLQPGELLDAVRPELRVLAYEDAITGDAPPRALQRICARREG